MIRDLWKNKVQFGAIFIMMFLGVFIFSGISSEYHGLEVALNNYIKENNLADAGFTKRNLVIRLLMN